MPSINLFSESIISSNALYAFIMPGRTVRPKKYQTGKSHKGKDKPRNAMTPGYRVSAKGKRYYEGRKNRSDLKGGI
jgi:hypothetical protein